MNLIQLLTFMNGAIMMAFLTACLVFAKSARQTGDRLFRIFAWAFLLFALERIALLLSGGMIEAKAAIYLIRCVAFLLIIWAVVDKNRKTLAVKSD